MYKIVISICFVWLWNFVSHTKEKTQADDFQE